MSTDEKTRAARDKDMGAITISLMGREFRVGCPEGEEKQLLASVDYLNRKLKEVRDTNKVVGNERIAIMAALNIAHEFMSNNGKAGAGSFDGTAFKRRILAMQETLDSALDADQENLF
jgi:cell division protein ZapA